MKRPTDDRTLRLRNALADLTAAEQAFPHSSAAEARAQRRVDDLRAQIAEAQADRVEFELDERADA